MRWLMVLLMVFTFVVPTRAQDDDPLPPRDPVDLAARYRGVTDPPPIPDLLPLYQVGDTTEFWVGKTTSDTPTRVTATLAAANGAVYLWVEEGIDTPATWEQLLTDLNVVVRAYRTASIFRDPLFLPNVGMFRDPSERLTLPDVDVDDHLYILYTEDLGIPYVWNPLDSQPGSIAPFSNQHEMLYINTTDFPNAPLTDPVYLQVIARAVYTQVMGENVPRQPEWLTDTLNWSLLFELLEAELNEQSVGTYLENASALSLTLPTDDEPFVAIAGRQLFLYYVLQRFGQPVYVDLFLAGGEGGGMMSALDAVLAANDVRDPVTGAPITAADVFADFAAALAFNAPVGDGRFMFTFLTLPRVALPSAVPNAEGNFAALPFAVQLHIAPSIGDNGGVVEVTVDAPPTVPRFDFADAREPDDLFFWSGGAANANPTMTRTFDLTGVSEDELLLTFDTWYDLDPDWHYAYVSVSTDDGETWTPLETALTTTEDRYGVSYGAGFTGISNPEPIRMMPALGVVISANANGLLVNDVVADGGAAAAGVLPGDVIIGYDGEAWQGAPDIFTVLSERAPGDTLNLLIARNGEQLDIPVVLGTREVEQPPIWDTQTVDLTPYAGEMIDLRFEVVTLPGREDRGFAVDNIQIDALDYTNDATDANGWTLDGFEVIDNRLPQRLIVNALMTGSEQTNEFPAVRRLVNAGEDANGSWRIALAPGELLALMVLNVNDEAFVSAPYQVTFTPAEE